MLTRRNLLATAGLAATACTRRKASGYSGFAFIANQEGEAVAAVDLTVFAVARHIRVGGRPTLVIAHPRKPFLYVLTPENGTVHEIKTDILAVSRKAVVAGSALSMRLAPDGRTLYVLCRQPRALVRFDTASFRPAGQIGLPSEPVDFELDREGRQAAVSYGPRHPLSLFEAGAQEAGRPVETTGDMGTLRFLSTSQTLIAANRGERMLSLYNVASRRLIVNLPLAVRPDNLCFKADGGELFITGEGLDAVVIVSPFYTPYVEETVLAGHAPGVMAASVSAEASPQYLFIANPQSGDVSILDILTRRVVAVTSVGTQPGHVIITPDDRYALVLNQGSGDLAVIRIANIARAAADFKRSRKAPLFMMVPVGSKPVSGAVVAI